MSGWLNLVIFLFYFNTKTHSDRRAFIKAWRDEMLKWNPQDYAGITLMRVPFDIIWTPGYFNN